MVLPLIPIIIGGAIAIGSAAYGLYVYETQKTEQEKQATAQAQQVTEQKKQEAEIIRLDVQRQQNLSNLSPEKITALSNNSWDDLLLTLRKYLPFALIAVGAYVAVKMK